MPRPSLVPRRTLAAMLLVAAVLFPATARGALLDANCPGPPNATIGYSGNERIGQTFTVLHAGGLVQAQAAIDKTTSGGDFQLQILATDASGLPVNGVLGMAVIPDGSVPSGPATLSGTFTPPVSVVAGQLYALVITRPGGGPWVLTDRAGNPCPGQEVRSPSQTGSWVVPSPNFDFVFQVFVNPTNDFTIGKLKKRTLSLTVPGPGAISVADAGGGTKAIAAAKRKLLKTSTATATAAGTVQLKLKLTKLAKKLFAQKGKLKVKAAVTFTPTGGESNTVTRKLKLK